MYQHFIVKNWYTFVVISDLVTTMSKKITDAAIAAGLIARSDDEQSENIPQLTENDHLLNTPINTNWKLIQITKNGYFWCF